MWSKLTNTPDHDFAPECFVLTTTDTRDDEQMAFQYAVSVKLPYRHNYYDHLIAEENRDRIGVAWTVRWQADGEVPEGWQSTDFSSTLPYVWLPKSGVDMLHRFLTHLKHKWLDLCNFEQDWLNKCRRDVFLFKGRNQEILDSLLRDAEWWTYLRTVVQQQVRDAKAFGAKYCSLHDGGYAATQLEEAADALLSEVSRQIGSLDMASKDLIQIVNYCS
ncbi:Ankyrin repeat protein [Aspergillus sclerotialis]|uniref:Ankyrin repeat protein n=1 Tax=Aspergillus sclerotialis TaxID=2070753 RepID=A0A3A2Z7N0_9EURO|nr:Ankyrin repeat protein [Aspergillus sclerotialis]